LAERSQTLRIPYYTAFTVTRNLCKQSKKYPSARSCCDWRVASTPSKYGSVQIGELKLFLFDFAQSYRPNIQHNVALNFQAPLYSW